MKKLQPFITIHEENASRNEQRLARSKSVDLVTLPSDVVGANCGNCKFFDSERKYCNHEKVDQAVSANMCCAEWDHEGAIREWEKNPNKED